MDWSIVAEVIVGVTLWSAASVIFINALNRSRKD